MKAILIISAFFPPEPVVSSKLSFDIATELSKDCRVIVLHNRLFQFERDYDKEMITVNERTKRRQVPETMEVMINLRANLA